MTKNDRKNFRIISENIHTSSFELFKLGDFDIEFVESCDTRKLYIALFKDKNRPIGTAKNKSLLRVKNIEKITKNTSKSLYKKIGMRYRSGFNAHKNTIKQIKCGQIVSKGNIGIVILLIEMKRIIQELTKKFEPTFGEPNKSFHTIILIIFTYFITMAISWCFPEDK